jgi:hypothetical protein
MITDKEIIERLARIEEKIDGMSGTKTAAFAALDKATSNEIRIVHLSSQLKFAWSLAGGSTLSAIAALVKAFLFG